MPSPQTALPSPVSKGAVSPFVELGAYEALWDQKGATFVRLAEKFGKAEDALPSHFVSPATARQYAHTALERMRKAKLSDFGVRVFGASEYPNKLRDAKYPIALLYYQGWWDIINSRSVAVVGSRKPSAD